MHVSVPTMITINASVSLIRKVLSNFHMNYSRSFGNSFEQSLRGEMLDSPDDSLTTTFEQELDLKNAIKAISWNERLLRCVGVWPLKVYDPIFLFFFTYLVLHCSLTLAEMAHGSKDIADIMANITENMVLSMTLVKITLCRVNRQSLAQLLMDIQEDFVPEYYDTKEERAFFMKYTKWPGRYTVLAVISMFVATTLYYINALLGNVQMAVRNSSIGNQLPYKTLNVIDLTDMRLYVFLCAYQFLVVPVIVFGYVGFDCLFTNLAMHITTQFAVLTCKVKDSLNNSIAFRRGMKELVLRHRRLIKLSEQLEDNFSIVILQQLLGTTVHICISGYHALVGTTNGQGITLVTFISYGFCVISTLFVYCYIGECLIQESTNFGNALYNYEWYATSPVDVKLLHICMLRTKKPQHLTSGKFGILSLSIFTDILKASMGYISMIRTFL